MGRCKELATAAVLCCLLHICGAVTVNCSAIQEGLQTTYHLQHDFSACTANPSDLDYSWNNASDHVLANDMGEDALVVNNNSISTLVLSQCIPDIGFTASCSLEGKEYKAHCTLNCTPSGQPRVAGTDAVPWIAAVIAVGLLLAGLCAVCYKRRDKIRRMGSCSQVGGFYNAVKMSADPPAAAVVEVNV